MYLTVVWMLYRSHSQQRSIIVVSLSQHWKQCLWRADAQLWNIHGVWGSVMHRQVP